MISLSIWPSEPLTPISRSWHFLKSNIVKTKLLLHNGKPYQTIWNGTIFGDLEWPTSTSPARLPAQLNAPHAHQSARFTACSASRRPTERGTGRKPGRRLETERTSAQLGPWLQAKTQQPIGVVGPVIIHVNGLAIWLGFVHMLPAALFILFTTKGQNRPLTCQWQ